MATVYQAIQPAEFLPTGNEQTPALNASGPASAIPRTLGLAFDASTIEAVQALLDSSKYGSGNLAVLVKWYADTASSGGVAFGASLCAVTPNTDTQDVEADAWATENTASDTHLGTTGQRLHSVQIDVSNLDSLAAGDQLALRLRRLPADAGDTILGDVIVTEVIVSYSDTP